MSAVEEQPAGGRGGATGMGRVRVRTSVCACVYARVYMCECMSVCHCVTASACLCEERELRVRKCEGVYM